MATARPKAPVRTAVRTDIAAEDAILRQARVGKHNLIVFGVSRRPGQALSFGPVAAALLESDCLAEIDCVISDIDMPVMDGFELSRVAHAARPELPVILITGQPEMLNRLPPIGPGHHRLFKKPFDGQELLAAVSDALRNPELRTP